MVPPANHGRRSLASAVAPGEQRPDARGIAEELVERERDEVGLDDAQVEPVGGHEGGAVEDHVPAVLVRLLDPLERVLHAAEVGLRRVGEQVVRAGHDGVAAPAAGALVQPQLRPAHGHVRDRRALARGRTRGCR